MCRTAPLIYYFSSTLLSARGMRFALRFFAAVAGRHRVRLDVRVVACGGGGDSSSRSGAASIGALSRANFGALFERFCCAFASPEQCVRHPLLRCVRHGARTRARPWPPPPIPRDNPMRILPLPSLRAAAPIALRAATPRADILEDLKYQLERRRGHAAGARRRGESVAFAYIIVLALLGGGLAYLLFLDTQASARNKAALEEQERAVAMMREQGLEAEGGGAGEGPGKGAQGGQAEA